MRKHYHVEVAQNDQLGVFCPQSFLRDKEISRIAFGSRSIDVDFIPHPDLNDRISISREIQKALKFPNFNIPLHVFLDNQSLIIGPLVGIFTTGFTSLTMEPIGERTLFFSKHLSVNKMVGALPFVFGEQHIDWTQETILGFFFHNNAWETIEVPFPNVIYDRLPNRRSESNPKLIKVRDRLQKEYFIPWYNPGFFNKLDIHEKLIQDETVANFLPETIPFTSFSSIEKMLSDYGHVFIKPINSRLGLGVHKIIYDKHTGDYFCRYQDKSGVNRLRKFSDLERLISIAIANQSLEKMLVQQGINLLRHESRSIDFRIHTNKDDMGIWHVSAIAAKLAGLGSVTTHTRSGGDIKTIEEIFSIEECTFYTEMLSTAALLLSNSLDLYVEGIISEIGFDLGIDRYGDVWLFEADSKPMSIDEQEIEENKIYRKFYLKNLPNKLS